MRGILYFSATGNSLDIALRLQAKLGGRIHYIPNYGGDGGEYDEIIVVSPIYSFGLPVHVYDLIPKLTKDRPVWIVLNYGGMSGGAGLFAYRHCKAFDIDVKGVFLVKMPENYTLVFSVPKVYERSLLKAAPKRIDAIAGKIDRGDMCIPKDKKTKEETYLKNRPTWHLIANDFSVSDRCVSCGKCVTLCPVDNITISDGQVRFLDKCVICLGCYHRCPQKAIQYKDKRKTDRYLNPNVREMDIGKDL